MKKFNCIDLYTQFCKLLGNSGTYGTDDRFNEEWFSLLANLLYVNIYVWSTETEKCLKYSPRVRGIVTDVEEINPLRRIVLIRTPGHYMAVAAQFITAGEHPDEVYPIVNSLLDGIRIRNLVSGGPGKSFMDVDEPIFDVVDHFEADRKYAEALAAKLADLEKQLKADRELAESLADQ